MSKILTGKKGLVFGALDERSLAWHVAQRCVSEGAQVVLTNTPAAIQLGEISELAAVNRLPLLPCDATDIDDIRSLLAQTQTVLDGKIDFVLHAVAQSVNLRRHKPYEQANYAYFQKTLDISALSLHKILSVAMQMDAIAQGGSVVALSYMASERFFQGYNDMSDAKAMLESIARQMGAIYGRRKQVRVNIVSPSAIPTKAGSSWDDLPLFYRYTDSLSPIGNADAEDCAGTCVALFSDLMKRVTMQTIYCDGGFGKTMLTPEFMEEFRKTDKKE